LRVSPGEGKGSGTAGRYQNPGCAPGEKLDHRSRLGGLFTQELIRRLRADGRVTILPPGKAEGELKCELKGLDISAVSYTWEGRVAAESARLSADCRLVLTGAEGAAWKSGALSAVEEYPVGDNYLLNEQVKAQALKEAVKDLSESVRSLLLDSF
jgi:hypothetical protein